MAFCKVLHSMVDVVGPTSHRNSSALRLYGSVQACGVGVTGVLDNNLGCLLS